MGQIEVNKSITINAPADDVWQVLSDGFADVGQWATAVDVSKVNTAAGEPLDGAPVAGRVCTAPGFGDINETIVAYDAALQTFTFKATASKIPSFVKDILSQWSLEPQGPDTTKATVNLTADAGGVMGAMMGPMMKRKFATTMDTTLGDLKSYVETGTPSSSKQKALAK